MVYYLLRSSYLLWFTTYSVLSTYFFDDWCAVAALLTPRSSLPNVTGVVVLLIVLLTVGAQLKRAARKARKLLESVFSLALQVICTALHCNCTALPVTHTHPIRG